MPYISSQEAFHGYTHAIIVGVYTDMITASAVKKDTAGAVVLAATRESMGSIGGSGEKVPVDNIMFNMEKAIMALPQETRVKGTTVIVAVGPGAGTCEYVTAVGKRDARERKITAEEVNMVITSVNTEKGNTVFKNYPEQFSIDGFSVPDPVGVNGGEITIGMVRVSCDDALEKECGARMAVLGLQYGGMIDMRYTAMHADRFFEKTTHALMVFVFEHETHIAMMREKAVYAIGTARGGYGILNADIAQAFSVGIEEAKEIVSAYRKQELNEGTKDTVENTCTAAAKKIIDITKEAITKIDSANIIPGTIYVACAHAVPEIATQFITGDWFKDLPIERNASVSLFSEEKSKGFVTPFDCMSVDFVTRHH